MAVRRWRGDAPAVSQVTEITPANVEVGDTFQLLIGGKTVSYAAQAATVANVTAGLAAAVSGSALPEFAELTATEDGTKLTLTAATAGRPFEVSTATINGGASDTQTLTAVSVTASSGPEHWDAPQNWSGGTVPISGDEVYIEDTDASIRYGLDQSGVDLASLNIAASFTGEIGLPQINSSGTTDYFEYRSTRLAVGAGEVHVGEGLGTGSGHIRLDTGATVAAVTVQRTGTSTQSDQPAFEWIGTHALNELNVLDGSVGVASEGGESATLATLRQAGGEVRCGAGLTVTNVQRTGGGTLRLRAAPNQVVQTAGTTVISGTGTLAAVELTGGTLDYRGGGTISDLVIDGTDATADFSADARLRTVSACTLIRGRVVDPHETVTWTAGVQPGAGLQAV